jgi:DNA adenine methylase
LRLHHVELHAGRSSQATLLGRAEITIESLYLSPALAESLNLAKSYPRHSVKQLALLEEKVQSK